MKTSKNRKKTISCVLATAMTAGLFTGCGTVPEDTSQPEATDVLDYVDEEYALKHYVRNNGYNVDAYPNAIDPSVFYDKDDRMWMVYGSWSGGIYLVELDPATGLVIHPEAGTDIMTFSAVGCNKSVWGVSYGQ